MKAALKLLFLLCLVGCSQPFDYERNESPVIVFDAKVSTMTGLSYVRIHIQEGDRQILESEFEVQIESENQSFDFTYDPNSGNYIPDDEIFAAIPGRKYRLEALSDKGVLYTSAYDSVPSIANFELDIRDTTIQSRNNNIIVEEPSKVAVAEVVSNGSLLRYSFNYWYRHFFTGDTTFVAFNNEYALIDHQTTFNERIDIEVALEPLRNAWFFWDPRCGPTLSPPCDPADPDCDILSPPCIEPCCKKFGAYLVRFEVRQEVLSEAAFEYWESVRALTRGDGLVFDVFPFPLKGNIGCPDCEVEAVGFFRAVSETIQSKETYL